jgi:1,4-dihydroxy-6-naphthoate synthase
MDPRTMQISNGDIKEKLPLTLAFSPCPNDTIIFHALLHGLVDTGSYSFSPFIDDVETLNRFAFEGRFDITKLSFFAYFKLKNKYDLLDAGAALGYGCGPLLVGRSQDVPPQNAKIAVPGEFTTAHLLLRLWNSGFKNIVVTRFETIMPGIQSGIYDAGVIIHEGRFVYGSYGCVKIVDLGEWWEAETGLPIPLGCIAIRKDIATRSCKEDIERMIRNSLSFGLADRSVSRDFVKEHSQELDDSVIDEHINLYVNNFSLSLGEKGFKAIAALEDMARQRGIL